MPVAATAGCVTPATPSSSGRRADRSNGPAELLVLLELLDAHGSPRPEVTRRLADLQQLLPDDVRLDCHGARAPARGGTRAGSSGGAPCRGIGGWFWSRRRSARPDRDTPDTSPS